MQSAVREWGHHSGQTDESTTREIRYIVGPDGYAYSPVWINPQDADTRGIKDKDIVKIFNERGIVLAAAVVAEKMIPGVIHMDKAGGSDMIDPVKINRAGNINSIATDHYASKHAFGLSPTGYLVEVAKVTGDDWDEWRATYPDAFARPQDPAYGPFFSGWVEGGN
jgi:trimethylamine-N-oxide reductase (cytochrome c)